MQSPTRMDVLSTMLNADMQQVEKVPSVKGQSPRDSLSPLDQSFQDEEVNGKSVAPPRHASPASSNAGTREAQQHPQQELHGHITFLEHGQTHAAATPTVSTRNDDAAAAAKQACSPRSSPLILRPHRPTDLSLTRSNGLTSTSTCELKQRIGDGHTGTDSRATRTQVPRTTKPPKRLPKTLIPAPLPIVMGNSHSSEAPEPAGPAADNASLTSVVRKPLRVLRKSSANMFSKRIDSKSPLPRPLTATSILVTQHQHHNDGASCDDDDDDNSPLDPFTDPAHAAREPVILHSASTISMTGTDGQPLSASTTLKQHGGRRDSTSPYQATVDDADSDPDEAPPPVPAHRSSALSPTLPAPSPLPEDSPHKYGLRDRVDTPELAQEEVPPPDINVMKARRRSSGLEIFNEAKSLQSAQSFLNGLSTSRRRAESTHNRGTHESSRPQSRPGSRAPSTRPPSAMHLHANTSNTHIHASAYTPQPPHATPPAAAAADLDGRRLGHNFKPTGFAYSRALNPTQLQCYRQHARLLRSKNRLAPVECAVCHMDDDQEHWTCSWCAVRMCRYCRKGFAEGGVMALRARVREAETGGAGEGSEEGEEGAVRGVWFG
ncbi:hypothetical protein LTR65_006065 [Meristemomyces frigidus]